jgi:flagellum-specific ATP synthase
MDLDGHIVLNRRLADRNHYPAIDILASISRVAPRLMGPRTAEAAGKIRRLVSAYREKEDLIDVGAYLRGTDPDVDEAIDKQADLNEFLKQGITEHEEPSSIYNRAALLAGLEPEDGDEEAGDEEAGDEEVSVFA